MRIAFAGTPEFARKSLDALIGAGHDVALVLTRPDRPAGRGMRFLPSPVKQLAEAHGIPIQQVASLSSADAQALLAEARVEVMVVAAFGLILPRAALALPTYGCLNVHASLLPRWRGAAPVQRAILAGDTETGACIMEMDAGLDTGPVLLLRRLPITAEDTAGTLTGKLAVLGARLIVEVLGDLPKRSLHSEPQPSTGITYAEKLRKDEAWIDWSQPASTIERKVRAFNPFPVAQTRIAGQPLRLWQARVEDVTATGTPGQVMTADAGGLVVACGAGRLIVTELQRTGGKRLSVRAFLAGNRIIPGQVLS